MRTAGTTRALPAPARDPARMPGRRRPGLAGSAAAATAGTVAAVGGAGLAGRHLPSGVSVVAVVGLVLALSGLVVSVTAVRDLWRGLRRWERLALPVGGLVALLLGLCTAIALMVTVVPPTPVAGPAPVLGGTPAQDVDVPGRDGVRRSAWWAPGRTGAAVVLLHGSGSNRAAPVPQAEVLASAGYGVLLLDAHGHGDSDGAGMDLGWYGDADVRAALDFLEDQAGVDPQRLGLLGLSMGGEEAVGAAGVDPRVRAVVAEGATARTAPDKAAWLPGGAPGAVQRVLDRVTFALVELLTSAPEPAALPEAVAAADGVPFLVITAGDVPDEARAAEVLQAAAPARVQVWTVPGASHTGGLRTAPDDWERRVLGFLDERL